METQLAQLQLTSTTADISLEGHAGVSLTSSDGDVVLKVYFESGYDAGREEFEILECLEEKDKEIEKLCNFLGGNFDSEEDVKKILKDHYSEEFIKTNTERWREVGIDFEEKEEYVPTGSKVDMEQFQKLMESGMVPWASKKSGEEE